MKNLFQIITAATLFGGILFSCKTTEDVIVDESSNNTQETPVLASDLQTEEPVDTIVKERSFFASIQRTPCFGTCPTYKMTIYSDGFVELKGIKYVDLIGDYTTTISKAQMKAIEDKAMEIKFMEMEDKYDGAVTDLPSAILAIEIDGVHKQVIRRYNYPKRILQLEILFDELIKSETWTKVEGEEIEK